MWKGGEAKKTRKLTHDEIRRNLIGSLVMNDNVETAELTKKVQEVEYPEKAAESYSNARVIFERRRKA